MYSKFPNRHLTIRSIDETFGFFYLQPKSVTGKYTYVSILPSTAQSYSTLILLVMVCYLSLSPSYEDPNQKDKVKAEEGFSLDFTGKSWMFSSI